MPIFSHTVTGYLFALLATVVWSGNFVVASLEPSLRLSCPFGAGASRF